MLEREKSTNFTVETAASAEGRFFSLSMDMLCIAGFDGYFKHLNSAWSQAVGYTNQELLSEPYLSFVHPDDRESTVGEYQRLFLEERMISFENRYRCRDGSYKWLMWNAIALSDEQLIYGIARDVTRQKELERHKLAQYTVSRVLAESGDLANAIPKVLQAIGESVTWDLGAMWQVDPSAHLLRCISIWLAPTVHAEEFQKVTAVMTFPPGVGLPGRVWATHEPATIPDIQKDKNFPRMPFASTSGIHAAFAFPVLCGSEVTGVIEFFSHDVHIVDYDLLQMMKALGNQIGQFMARKRAEEEREKLILDLQEALGNVKTLSGLLPICSTCKKVRDDKGYWNRIEDYISAHSEAMITHGICTDCARRLHPDWDEVK